MSQFRQADLTGSDAGPHNPLFCKDTEDSPEMRSKAMEGLKEYIERRADRARTMTPPVAAASDAVFVVSRKGIIKSILQAPAPGPDGPVMDLLGKHIDTVWPADLIDEITDALRETLRGRKVRTRRLTHADDPSLYEFICIPQGPDRAILIFHNVTERHNSRVRRGTHLDSTTTLPTREYLFSELQRITEMQRLKEGRAAMICINIGQLDDAGHVFGPGQQDSVLKELGRRLKTELRGANDHDNPDLDRLSIVTRFDFRQFAVILPSIDTGDDAESVTRRLIAALEEPIAVGGRDIRIHSHAGIALFPQDGIDPETLFNNAFTAMEYACTNDAGPYTFHSGTVNLRNLQRQDLEVGLRSGLEREEFTLNFLPVIDARTREVAAVEALLRWPEQVLGSRSVRQVVTLAERTGLILPIGEWVLKKSCEQVLHLRAAGDHDLRLSINITAQEFSRPEFAPQLASALENLQFDPALLDLEIQEHVLSRDAMSGYSGCRELKAVGVGIVVDDYGTGGCSLTHLAQSPVDGIKIDNSLVANLESNDRDRAACDAAISMAQSLGIRSIAEGIETEGQAAYLAEHGCDYLQGFYLSEPLPNKALEDLMSLTRTGKIARIWSRE